MALFIPGISKASQDLDNWLSTHSYGYETSYKELSEIARGDVRTIRSGNLRTAFSRQRKNGRIWGNRPNVGYFLMTPDEVVLDEEKRTTRSLHRKADRSYKVIDSQPWEAISGIGQLRAQGRQLRSKATMTLNSKKAGDKIVRELMEKGGESPSVKDVLGLFARRS